MPRPDPILSEQLLLSFADAMKVLRCSQVELVRLIDQGHLRPHPVLAGRIARPEIERFALDYVSNAETDTEERRTVDAPASEENWGVPALRLR